MTSVILTNNQLTMSSSEMSDLTKKRHDNVKRLIESLANQGVIQHPQIEEVKNHLGQTVKQYQIGKRDSYIVVAQLSPEFTAKLVDRWQELEKQSAFFALPNFNDPIASARAWADQVEQKQKALETIKTKDELLVAVADLNIKAGQVSIAEFAKNLAISGLGQNNLFKWLRGRGYLQDNNQPYQQYVTRGYFVMKPYDEKIKGEVKYKTMLTPRVTAWLSRVLHAEFELEIA